MADVYIFLVGLIVTAITFSAVALLLWGAANEPEPGPEPASEERPRSPHLAG